MTAWQDLPPQTRRQARKNERGAPPTAEVERAENDSDQKPAHHQPFHQIADQESDREQIVAAYSRRARRAGTAGSPPANQFFPSPGTRTDATPADFVARDFRPDTAGKLPARGSSNGAGSVQATPMRQVPRWATPSADNSGDLAYYTQAIPTPVHRPTAPPVVDSVPADLAAPPRAMTRRQLRELEARQGLRPRAEDDPASAGPAPAPVVRLDPPAAPRQAPIAQPAPLTAAPPPSLVTPAAPLNAPVAPVSLHPAPLNPVPASPAPPAQVVPAPLVAAPKPPALVDPAPPSARVLSPEPIVFADASGSVPAQRRPSAGPVPMKPVGDPPAQAPQGNGIAASLGIDLAPDVLATPAQPWPAQPDAGTATSQPGDSFFRTVGTTSGALTTSALVMPSIPQLPDITLPFSSTGEILITGSIDLPHSFGTTGAHPARFDNSDIDALFAEEDHDYAQADAAPVRAIRAVSTHTSTHGVISAKKPASNKLPMMMAVTAGILAVGVAALFAAGMIFGYF